MPIQARSATFDIPSDIWIEVAALLDPPDVLALQTTCRILRDGLDQRAVWVRALRLMCCRNAVFYPSYPVEDMSTTQLQRAATAPYRFDKLTQRHASLNGHDINLPVLEPASKIIVPQSVLDASHCTMFLVPGGRFLVAMNARLRMLSLWDLGPSGQPLPEPVRLAEVDVRLRYDNMGAFMMGVRLVVCMNRDLLRIGITTGKTTIATQVYEIGIEGRSTAFATIGTLVVDARGISSPGVKTMLMHGDLVYLQVGDEQGSAVIWNCREDWYIPGPCLSGGTHLSQQYLFIGDALVGLDQESASIWDLVPRLDKENRRNLETSIPHIRLREVPPDLIPACVSRHQDHCNIPDFSAPSVWYHNRSPLYIDAFRLSNNGERNGCARYRLDVARFPGFSTITAELSRTATFTFPPNSSFSTPYNPTHHISPGFTSGALVKSYQDSGHWSMDPTPYCLYSVPGDGFEDSPGSSSQANHVAKLTKLFSYEGEWSRYLGLCTWSGRMLYGGRDTTLSTLAGARPRPVIYVVDYLSL